MILNKLVPHCKTKICNDTHFHYYISQIIIYNVIIKHLEDSLAYSVYSYSECISVISKAEFQEFYIIYNSL